MQGKNFQNASELNSKRLHFLDPKIVKMHPELFHKACMEKTSKMHLNSTASSFVFGRTNRENTPKHFCKLWRRTTQKMHLNFTANSFGLKRKNCGKCTQNFFLNFASGEFPKCV